VFSSESLDVHVIPGISLGFALVFFVPLLLVVLSFFFYCAFAKRSVVRVAKILSALWLLACVPVAFLVLMGFAFNSSSMSPIIAMPFWVAFGLVALWLPVAMRRLFGIKPV
jgi:hypothetical protein